MTKSGTTKRNILITGGSGNLGSRLTIPLVQRGDRIVLFDVRSTRRPEPEFREVPTIIGDLADRDAVLPRIEHRDVHVG